MGKRSYKFLLFIILIVLLLLLFHKMLTHQNILLENIKKF